MNCNTSVWPSESLHCGKRDPIRPWKRVLMNGERASPFGPMLSYIYLTRNHILVSCYPIGRGIVVFDFFSFLSFFFPPHGFQPTSHQIEQFSPCSCFLPRYSSFILPLYVGRFLGNFNPLITLIGNSELSRDNSTFQSDRLYDLLED